MTKYLVIEKYYDDGEVRAFYGEYNGEPIEGFSSCSICDTYRSLFNTRKEAQDAVDAALNA